MLSGGARRLAALYGVKPGRRAVVATVDDRGLDDALALHAARRRSRGGRRPAGALPRTASRSPAAWRPVSTVVRGADGCPRRRRQRIERGRDDRPRSTPDGLAVADGRARLECDLHRGLGRRHSRRCRCCCKPAGAPTTTPRRAASRSPRSRTGSTSPGRSPVKTARSSRALRTSWRVSERSRRWQLGDQQRRQLQAVRAQLTGAACASCASPPRRRTRATAVDGKCFVDLDEDVTTKDIARAAVERATTRWSCAKRYTTVTMGPSQGRFSQVPPARPCSGCDRALWPRSA